MNYSIFHLLAFALIYSFLGWLSEVCYYSVKNRRFENRGFLNLPLNISYGVLAVILLNLLPTMKNQYLLQYAVILIVLSVIRTLTDFFIENIGKFEKYEYIDEDNIDNSILNISKIVLAAICLLIYIVVHPVLYGVAIILPDVAVKIIAVLFVFLVVLDFVCTLYAMRTGNIDIAENITQTNKNRTQKTADKIIVYIWKRLEKTYPGVTSSQKSKQHKYIFAKGISFDKLIWVFLVSSMIGAVIEMIYCYSIDGYWMNRSSVLYGPFSFVWGIGAVLLTVALRKFQGRGLKKTVKTFAAGFLIGGVYEYLCSVFTELVFGTVFWDYSNMPLNIGGRTNVVYCVFWGLLAVVWLRIIYPPMSRQIEKLPPLWGKIITWAILFVMICNGVLTGVSMIRYTERQTEPQPSNTIEQLADLYFNDEFMENRWPNMIVAK